MILLTFYWALQTQKRTRRDFCLKLNVLLRIRVSFGNIFMTQISYHWHLSDNSDKWLEDLFNPMWLIDEPHSMTCVFHVHKTVALPATVFVQHHLHRKCLYKFRQCQLALFLSRASWHSSATLTEVLGAFSSVVRQMPGYNS